MTLPQVAASTVPRIPLEEWYARDHRGWSRVPLAQLPTRVHRLGHWSSALGAEVWIKRDDETSSLYGGNKPRKLEFLLGEVQRRGYRAVLTFGGLGTHHGLATAVFARELGLRVLLGLLYQPVTPAVRENLLCLHALGARLFYGASVPALVWGTLRELWVEWLQRSVPYIIPTGGTSPVGTLGYVNAGLELAEQIRRHEVPSPAYIFVPLGSGGTVAGLSLAMRLAGLPSKVVGILVTDIFPPSAVRLLRLAQKTARLIGPEAVTMARAMSARDFVIERDFVGGGYGQALPAADQLAAWLRAVEGIEVDATYTAKTAYALDQTVRAGRWGRGPFLFWLTFSRVRIADRLQPLPDFRALPASFHKFFA